METYNIQHTATAASGECMRESRMVCKGLTDGIKALQRQESGVATKRRERELAKESK